MFDTQSDSDYLLDMSNATATITASTEMPNSAWSQSHRYDHCDMTVFGRERNATLAPMAAAFNIDGAAGVIAATKGGTRNGYIAHAWALAMSAVYGPVGVHETQGEHPEVIRFKAQALADLATYLGA